MGEHITQKGIGNGISIILFAGIVSRGPSLMRTLGNLFQTGTSGIVSAILMIDLPPLSPGCLGKHGFHRGAHCVKVGFLLCVFYLFNAGRRDLYRPRGQL